MASKQITTEQLNKVKYFNEFYFQQLIEEINKYNKENNLPGITTSFGRYLHEEVSANLSSRKTDMARTGFVSLSGAITDAFTTAFGEENNLPDVFGREFYDTKLSEFQNLTGFGIQNPNSSRYLPMSPYDERYSYRQVFLQNGGNLLYTDIGEKSFTAKSGETYSYQGVLDENGSETNQGQEFIPAFRLRGEEYIRVGSMLSDSDKTGLSYLSRYMTEEEFRDVSDWVGRPGRTNPNLYMSRDAVTKAAGILEHLQEEGFSYRIERDKNPGQIKACINDTKIEIRIMDVQENEHYIGRIYDNGYTYRYNTNKLIGGQGAKQKANYISNNIDDFKRLLDFALGRSTSRMDSPKPIGEATTYTRGKTTYYNAFYSRGNNKNTFTAVAGPYPGDSYSSVRLYAVNERSARHQYFATPNDALGFLENAVKSARANFIAAVDIETLIKEAELHKDDDTYTPVFHGDSGIAALQQNYWDVLTGKQADIFRVGANEEDYIETIGDIDAEPDEAVDRIMKAIFGGAATGDLSDEERAEYVYLGTSEEKVRQHLLDVLDKRIGNVTPVDGKTFDPVFISKYMSSEFGVFRNNEDITEAILVSDFPSDSLIGEDFHNARIKDKLIKFDEASAKPMFQHPSSFIRSLSDEIQKTLTETGCTVSERDILIDDNGIVSYKGMRTTREKMVEGKDSQIEFTGQIGQIFIPDGLGLVETKFAGSENYMFVPGYEAYVIPQKRGENLSLEERTRLRGYDQMLRDRIRYQIRSDILENVAHTGETTSLNQVYRRMYDTRYSLTYLQDAKEEGMSEDFLNDIIRTNARRVKYDNVYKEGSTINADYQAQMRDDFDNSINDNYASVYSLTGRRNMTVMSPEGDGFFDPIATGTGTNQGIVRFLTEGAEVTSDGRIIPSEDKSDMTPIMKNDILKYMKYTPFDRQQMTFSNVMKASAIAEGVHTAHMTFGGWTFDDGYVVSKDFAENHPVRGQGGEMRMLRIGDKISDMNGNKGVISLVVDPDMDLAEAEEKGILEPVKWFKANKDAGYELDVVGAPFTAPSRFNGGTAREMMETAHDLIGPDGKVYEGCMGSSNFIITHMVVDEKTHIYGEDELAKGKGRKVSAQLAWALDSQGAFDVLSEAYSSNSKAVSNLREVLIATGLDMDNQGNLRVGYDPHPGEVRQIWNMPDLEYRDSANGSILDVRSMKSKFSDVISQRGGFLEIPFSIKFANGEETPVMKEDGSDILYDHKEWERKGYTYMRNGKEIVVPPTTVHRDNERIAEQIASRKASGDATYALPIMSSHLRSGQVLADGTSHVHDYTVSYLRIYEAALRYRDAEAKGNEKLMASYQEAAQAEYDKFSSELISRKFQGKHNAFRDELMANRMPRSATAVWTADPRLDIDEIAMPTAMANSLGVVEGNYVMTWRDPVLRDAGVRYNRVKINDELTGIAINPVMDKSYDGDFDGDSIGVLKLQTKAGHKDAMNKLSVGANLLDFGTKKEDGTFGLMMQDSLDMKSVEYEDESLSKRLSELEAKANEYFSEDNRGTKKQQDEIIGNLSFLTHEMFSKAYGTDMICYSDMESHIRSVSHMIDNGAKGSYSKLKMYARYLGVDFEIKEVDGKESIDYDTFREFDDTLATREDHLDVEYATGVKAFGTGVAGKYSQRAIAALRNSCPKAVLELTYPVTQAILQAKHDPIDARHKYEMLMGPARALWRGEAIERKTMRDGTDAWVRVRDAEGKPVQMDKESWKEIFKDFYNSKDGLNVAVNPDYVDEVAKYLSDEDGVMRNMEANRNICSVMDTMAYDGTFENLKEFGVEGRNVFEGTYNAYFMPTSVKKNIELAKEGKDGKAIIKQDILVSHKTTSKSDMIKTTSVGRKELDVSDIKEPKDDGGPRYSE